MKISHEPEIEEGGFADIVTRVRDTLRRRWITFLAITLSVFALAVVGVFLMTPKYTSVASVRIDPSRAPVTSDQQKDSDALSPEAIETEVSLIRSNDVAQDVVKRLQLYNDPEFTKSLNDEKVANMTPADRATAVAGEVLSHLSVSRDKLSYLLGIGFTSVDRMKSEKIANAFATSYLFAKVGSKANSASQKATFLQKQLDELGDNIRSSQSQLAAYRAQTGITASTSVGGQNTGTVIDQQISPLSGELAQAKSAAAAANAELATAEAQAKAGHSDTVSAVLDSPVIGALRAQRSTTLQLMGTVLARYGDKHPETIRMRDQLNDIDSQIAAETTRIMASLRSKAVSANARSSSLQASMDQLASKQADDARAGVLATGLDTDIASKRQQYDKLSQALIETNQAANNQIAQAEIVDYARAPLEPTSPNKPLFLALGLMIALLAGAATITVQEMLVTGIGGREDIEDHLGVPMLAAVPREKLANPADLVIDKPTSLFSESFRIARASLIGVRELKSSQAIAVTSALPSEGKSVSALALARTFAISGQRTVLLDCDVRRAVLRGMVRNPQDRPGTVELLHGTATIDQVVTPGDVDNLDQILVREPYFTSENLFGAPEMRKLLESLRSRYQIIVLDLPPLMGLADGRFIAALADSVALVVRWNDTPVNAVMSAMSSLQADDTQVAGVILTMVDSNAEAAGALYYSKKYTGYYQKS